MTAYSAVSTTGIYCRPGCSARPLAENVRTYQLPAAAEAAGFRACLRCRPYRVAAPLPSSAPELVCRAVQLIIEGALDNGGSESDLAAHLAVSPRHLRRLFGAHLGVTPDQLARSRCAHFARRLLDDSDLRIADIAFAAGFGSLRQFNRDMRAVFRAAPGELRGRRRRADRLAADGGLSVRLPFPPPLDWAALAAFLGDHAVPGVESVEGGVYRRTISLDGAPGVVEVGPGGRDHLLLRLHLPYWDGLIHVVERAARMVGADTDVSEAAAGLAGDPVMGALVAARPGVRVPGTWGPFEATVAAVVAERSAAPAQARAALGRLAGAFGQPVAGLSHGLSVLFPSAEVLADADLAAAGLRPDVGQAVTAVAGAVAAGGIKLDGDAGWAEVVASLAGLPGVGMGAAQRAALRLGHPDAFPGTDPRVRAALGALGADEPADSLAARWRPWRALAAAHLIAHGAG